eukprot:CAMPEP_0183293262 /NCGR_PEP_ID=MMETSP0160_2-20130417/2012_1 /TAXON_ID=2839 ORGANISM="Odontella Sinensis, Strain Grunow 1884" /NCGR_SAMPLE_ID=MMETSP0160_2 /ASSEMBLY_ACC=CAM_ASM_000250 /LENGTH=262 /DNA_ID=CAMNT_0025454349 /DNA_START=239 /DNA_END=1024 /DNA_ORIENTATION=+
MANVTRPTPFSPQSFVKPIDFTLTLTGILRPFAATGTVPSLRGTFSSEGHTHTPDPPERPNHRIPNPNQPPAFHRPPPGLQVVHRPNPERDRRDHAAEAEEQDRSVAAVQGRSDDVADLLGVSATGTGALGTAEAGALLLEVHAGAFGPVVDVPAILAHPISAPELRGPFLLRRLLGRAFLVPEDHAQAGARSRSGGGGDDDGDAGRGGEGGARTREGGGSGEEEEEGEEGGEDGLHRWRWRWRWRRLGSARQVKVRVIGLD